jgi:hypothetical protein
LRPSFLRNGFAHARHQLSTHGQQLRIFG